MPDAQNDLFQFDVATAAKPRPLPPRIDGKSKHHTESAAPFFVTLFLGLAIGSVWIGWKLLSGAYSPAAQQVEAQRITLDQFSQIKPGQTYDEVKAILGRDGKLVTSSEYSTRTTGSVKTANIDWDNSDYSSIHCMFRNGRLARKSQFGLR